MVLIITCYLLGIAMLYLGFSTGRSEGFTFGIILLVGGLFWHYKTITNKK